ncbi:hypothetical protein RUM43_000307 [Polyplax serrata]|uniref:ATP-dependent (S)-NAD(P)H-hydrate dehydratase n=1 Tax=Polyplax serrata TaxID=468196 RepID=A0AAN8SCM2_POLSC
MNSIVTVGKKFIKLEYVRKLVVGKLKGFCLVFNAQESTMSQLSLSDQYVTDIKKFIPKLTSDLRKGQCGRIGVIGGSAEYTGAPYFSAISALKLGADLVYVFCCKAAAPVIKSYSPELIVLPILDDKDVVQKIESWLPRLHALVIGPGLGRDPDILQNVTAIINYCSEKVKPLLPLVIDADGLYVVQNNISLIQKYTGPVILTPNGIEYCRLSSSLSLSDPLQIATSLNSVVLHKGSSDVIVNGISNMKLNLTLQNVLIKCDVTGSVRRCGGQGDILSGCIATFVAWYELHRRNNQSLEGNSKDCNQDNLNYFKTNLLGYSLSCYAGCVLTRTCSRLAFKEFGRSMTASDMIPFINKAFESNFGE